MTLPSDGELLALWDRAAQLPALRRSLALLTTTGEDANRLTIGEGERRLYLLRRQLFGDRVEGLTECPQCNARVEIEFRITALGVDDPASDPPAALTADGYTVRWRLPTWGDLTTGGSAAAVRDRLLHLCLEEVRHDGRAVSPADCPPSVVTRVGEAMTAWDRFAEVRFDMTCPECGAGWRPRFDIGRFLWREFDAWARRLLRDVHALAAAYGWGERDVLALSPSRRRAYLDLVGA